MMETVLGPWPTWLNVVVFLAAAAAVAAVGPKLARLSEELGTRLDISQGLVGALLLGMTTSLPGITAVASAGIAGRADLAVSTALGGIIAQSSFLVVADLFYRKRNMEYDVRSTDVMLAGSLLIALLGLVIMAIAGPRWELFHLHPATLMLPLAWVAGIAVIDRSKEEPGWRVTSLAEAIEEDLEVERDEYGLGEQSTARLIVQFAVFAAVVAAAGWLLSRAGSSIGDTVGVDESLAGSLLIGQATSLPELVTAVAAARMGAPALAIGNIIGGNAFDVLFVAIGDLSYTDGSIYHAVSDQATFLAAMGALVTTVLVMGLIRRQEYGILNLGFEEVGILVIYLGGFGMLFIW